MMPTMPPDSHKISLKIIEAIKQHPVLYVTDIKGNSIKVQEFRQKVWKRISDELSLDPTWVRLKWKNLRDTYCRILKYKNKTDKGARRKKWIFEDHLNFLKFPYESGYQPQCVELTEEYIREIERGSASVGAECLLEQLEDKNDDQDYSEYLEVLEETTADPVLGDGERNQAAIDSSEQRRRRRPADGTSVGEIVAVAADHREDTDDGCPRQARSKYRKIMPKTIKSDSSKLASDRTDGDYGILENQVSRNISRRRFDFVESDKNNCSVPAVGDIEAAESTSTADSRKQEEISSTDCIIGKTSIELFFNSMAQSVKLLPLKAQVEIKMAVCKIVTEAEVRYSKRNSLRNTQKFIAPPGMIPKLVLIPCNMIDDPNGKN